MPRFPLHRTLGPLGVTAKVASSWWLSGGISASNAVAAYAPKGAASLAASYTNLANPGTYDAAPGVAPTFDTSTGWTFNGTTHYLTTGITPEDGWSAIVRFSGAANNGLAIFGTSNNPGGAYKCFWLIANDGSKVQYGHQGTLYRVPGMASGVLAFAGQQGYRDGAADGGAIPTSSGSYPYTVFLGATNFSGGAANKWPGVICALAFYNTTLSAAQVAAVTTAMNAL